MGIYRDFPSDDEIEQRVLEDIRLGQLISKREYNKDSYYAYRGKLCWLCKKEIDGGVYCEECANRLRSYYGLRIQANICTRCGKRKALDGGTRCKQCRDRDNATRRKRREKGKPN